MKSQLHKTSGVQTLTKADTCRKIILNRCIKATLCAMHMYVHMYTFHETGQRCCEYVPEQRNERLLITWATTQLKALEITRELDTAATKFKASLGLGWQCWSVTEFAVCDKCHPALPLDLSEKLLSFQCCVTDLEKKHSYLRQVSWTRKI